MIDRLLSAIRAISDPATLLVNLTSVVALALTGFILNVAIGRTYGLEGLGVFNQALTLFLILGQVAAGGWAFGALHYFSVHGAHGADARAYLLAAALPVALIGGVIAVGLQLGADWIGAVLGSQAVAGCLPAVGIAIALFALNKIGVNALNGMSHLKTYAALQGLRMPIMLASLVVLTLCGASSDDFGWIFVASEAVILSVLIVVLARYTTAQRGGDFWVLLRETANRGWRGALIGLLADVNSKVDLLMLGLFLPDKAVGIYALGMMFADGLRMVLAAVQSIINPRITIILQNKDVAAWQALWRNVARTGRAGSAIIGIIVIAVMMYLIPLILLTDDIHSSVWVFVITAGAITVAAPAVIFNQTFTQAGAPVLQTQFLASLAVINLVLNFALIPIFGPLGAALATATAELAQLVLLRRWLWKVIGSARRSAAI